jgi:hypothetical protein
MEMECNLWRSTGRLEQFHTLIYYGPRGYNTKQSWWASSSVFEEHTAFVFIVEAGKVRDMAVDREEWEKAVSHVW